MFYLKGVYDTFLTTKLIATIECVGTNEESVATIQRLVNFGRVKGRLEGTVILACNAVYTIHISNEFIRVIEIVLS